MMLPVAPLLIFRPGNKYVALPTVSFHITAQLLKLLCLSSFCLCVRVWGVFNMTISLWDPMYSQTVPSASRSLLFLLCVFICAWAFMPYRYCSVRHFAADTINHWSMHADTQTVYTSPPGEINKFTSVEEITKTLRQPLRHQLWSTFFWNVENQASEWNVPAWFSFLFICGEICRTGLIENTPLSHSEMVRTVHSRWQTKRFLSAPPKGSSEAQTLLLIWNRETVFCVGVNVWNFVLD